MQEIQESSREVKKVSHKKPVSHKKQIAALSVLAIMMVAMVPASAGYVFNGTLSDLGQVITDFLTLSDELIQLVIFGVVITAAGAIGGFITGFFGIILSSMRIRF